MRQAQSLSFWVEGVQSFLHPADIKKTQYAWGENIVNRGGIIQTRPGNRLIASIKGTNPQGFCTFKPRNAPRMLVAAVDGKIYTASWPKFEFKELEGISFSPTAEKIHFCECLRSAQRNPDGTIEVITPTPVLIIQDGVSRAGFWDGSSARHCKPDLPYYETPSGTWMTWSASRLWMIKGSKVVVSDLADPLSFEENTILSLGRGGFELPDEGTGIVESADESGVLAFTHKTTTALKSFIRDRSLWAQTPNFSKVILPKVGCVAGRSVVNQYGATEWLSDKGWISLDAALYTEKTNRLLTEDTQMMRSKRNLSANRSGACAAEFENMLLVSVPSGSKHNAQTWVRDQAALGDAKESPAAVWVGVWSGPRPVQYAQGLIGGKDRLYFLSYDSTTYGDTRIHIGEAFHDSREDAGGRIQCQWQTGILAAEKLIKFKMAEFEACEILGRVDMQVYVCGVHGGLHKIGDFKLQAEKGSIGSKFQRTIKPGSTLRAFKPQSRTLKTEEFDPQGIACHPERNGVIAGIDKGFYLLFVWRGRAGIREVSLVFDPETPDLKKGECSKDESDQHNAVSERGEAITE